MITLLNNWKEQMNYITDVHAILYIWFDVCLFCHAPIEFVIQTMIHTPQTTIELDRIGCDNWPRQELENLITEPLIWWFIGYSPD